MKTCKNFFLIVVFSCVIACAMSGQATDNQGLINLVAIGYDVENNPKATEMLNEMAKAARDSGAIGEVIMAGEDEEQLDIAMKQAMSIAVQSSGPQLVLKTDAVAPGDEIIVVHSDITIDSQHAWIGFYENESDSDDNYIFYAFLVNLTDRTYSVKAPLNEGAEYHFRIFLTKEYKAAARSDNVIVTNR